MLRRGLILYLPFDRDEGGVVTDRSGHGNDGKVHGATWRRDGVANGAMTFQGQGGIDLGDLAAVENQYELSWAARVWLTGSSDLNGVMGKARDGDEVFYLCMSPRPQSSTVH
jgi:hypothetical protein